MMPELLATAMNLQWIVFAVLAVVLLLGLIATFSPDRFANIASRGSRWIDADRLIEFLEKPINVDRHVLRYSRVFGVVVVLAALWLGYVYWVNFVLR